MEFCWEWISRRALLGIIRGGEGCERSRTGERREKWRGEERDESEKEMRAARRMGRH